MSERKEAIKSHDAESTLSKIKGLLQQWIEKQGHDRCWYYPDIFNAICKELDIAPTKDPALPPRDEFEKGCCKYQKEQYET